MSVLSLSHSDLLQEGNLPQFYLNNDFTAAKKVTKDPEPKKVSLVDVVQTKKQPEPTEPETVSEPE